MSSLRKPTQIKLVNEDPFKGAESSIIIIIVISSDAIGCSLHFLSTIFSSSRLYYPSVSYQKYILR